jgi:hypothetical protein
MNSRVSRSETAAVVCPPEFISVPTLASFGAAIGNSYILEVKKGWEENTPIHVAVFADPGSKRSFALSKATLQALVPTPGPRP